MSFENTALILLAAGRGTRMGGGKLGADLGGKPLARHAADRLAALPFSHHIAVCSATTPDLPGFTRVPLIPADGPLSASIATGVRAADGASAVLIALADMPLVPASHFMALADAFDGAMVASAVSGRAMVPALFGRLHFDALVALEGDRGAGHLLRNAPAVALDAVLALDVDTHADLERAANLLEASQGPFRYV